jgi:hypothetical protein
LVLAGQLFLADRIDAERQADDRAIAAAQGL